MQKIILLFFILSNSLSCTTHTMRHVTRSLRSVFRPRRVSGFRLPNSGQLVTLRTQSLCNHQSNYRNNTRGTRFLFPYVSATLSALILGGTASSLSAVETDTQSDHPNRVNEQAWQPIETVIQPIIKAALELAEQHAKQPTLALPIVAIGGCSGTGKTTLTQLLKERLEDQGKKVIVLKLDDFIYPVGQLKNPVKHPDAHPNFDGNRALSVLEQLKDGFNIIIAQPKWERIDGKHVTVEVTASYLGYDLIIMEGIYAAESTVYGIHQFATKTIFIDAPAPTIYEWMCKREEAKGPRKRTPEKFSKDIGWDLEDNRKVIAPSRMNADFVITKQSDHRCILRRASSGL